MRFGDVLKFLGQAVVDNVKDNINTTKEANDEADSLTDNQLMSKFRNASSLKKVSYGNALKERGYTYKDGEWR